MKMALKTQRAKAVATSGRKVTKKAQPKVSKSSRKGTR
jgi:hypothetical protein